MSEALKKRAEAIRNETTKNANTAQRVGGVMVDTVRELDEIKAKLDSIERFQGVVYFGTSTKTALTEADIIEFYSVGANRALAEIFPLNCSGGKYPYVVIPNSAGARYIHINGILCTDITSVTLIVKGVICSVIRLNQIQTGDLFCSIK